MPRLPPYLQPAEDGALLLSLKVVPGGTRDAIGGALGTFLRVKVSAPAEGGKANRAVLALLAERLGVPTHRLEMRRGHASPRKIVAVQGLDADVVAARLEG